MAAISCIYEAGEEERIDPIHLMILKSLSMDASHLIIQRITGIENWGSVSIKVSDIENTREIHIH